MPASAPALAAAPLPRSGHRRSVAESTLRASVRASYAEGAASELFTACAGGAVLTAWAIYLGASPFIIGMLGALPMAAQILQIPGAWLTQTYGARRVAIAAIGASRFVWLPVALLPFVDLPPSYALPLFVGVVAMGAVFAVVGNNAWIAWMGDLVPDSLRGRFFSRRTVYITLAGTAATLAAGVALDYLGTNGWRGETLAGLAAVAGLAGGCSVWLLFRQHDPGSSAAAECPDWRVLGRVARDNGAGRFLRYLLGWNAAVGLSASFFSFHMLVNLQTGFVLAALHGVAVAVTRIAAAPAWGRAVDRLGARPVLILCSFGIAAVPAIWLFATPSFLWPLALEAVLAGILWGGHGIAAMDLTIHLSPRRERAFYVAVFAAAGGLGFAAASVVSGVLASQLPARFAMLGWTWTNLHVLFLLSAVARLVAAVAALRIEERNARGVRDLLRTVLAVS
ncbi:MAG TPA: MFS transporter [Methylomirabilota bacterium]|nr:MFS transporter [Methylomirabilota bacterium]